MDKKTIIVVIGLILILGGIALTVITEPVDSEGLEASFSISEMSEEKKPYLLQGLIAISIGVITVLVALFKMV
ncbi:MAG: hypothetical protein ACOCTN_07085 [Candidatus Natronoplasma sp.]